MGKKWGWFYAVKKALSPADPTKVVVDKKDPRCRKSSKRKWFGRYNSGSTSTSSSEHVCWTSEQENKLGSPPCVYHDAEVDTSSIIIDNNNPDPNPNPNPNHHHHVYTVAIATAAAAAQAAAEAVWLSVTRLSGKSKEEAAAIRIQATFRGYMGRKVYRGMRGLGRLKTLVQGQYVNKQAITTLRCMQTLARVQSQVRARRIRMSEENQLLHKQRQQQTLLVRDHKDDKQQQQQQQNGEGWNGSPRSKEQMEARIQRKQQASLRRERALAYAFTHQIALRNKFLNPLMEPNSPIWGWSWLERWMATRPWDNIIIDHNPRIMKTTTLSPRAPISSTTSSSSSAIIKKAPPTRRMYHSLSCAPSLVSLVKGKVNQEKETTNQHQHQRRHSITGFSITTSRSLRAPSPSIDTSSSASLRKSRSRPASPSPNNTNYKDKTTTTTTTTTTPLKKRTSFLTSPIASRRHSARPT